MRTPGTLADIWSVGQDATEERRFEEACRILAPVFDAVRAHGEQEGIDDYMHRSDDVAHGEDETWAWPFAGADDAYLNAVSIDQICREIGLPDDAWNEIADEWLDAFQRGYCAAHEAA